MFNKLLKEIAHICIIHIPGYMVGRRGKTLYVQNGRKVKCQRRYVTQLVDKLGTRSIRIAILPYRELPVSLSFRCAPPPPHTHTHNSTQYSYFYIIYTPREFRSYLTRATDAAESSQMDDGRALRSIFAVFL